MSCTPSTSKVPSSNISIKGVFKKLRNISAFIKALKQSIIPGTVAAPIVNAPPAYVEPISPIQADHASTLEQAASQLGDIERKLSGGSQISTFIHDLHVNVGGQFVGADVAPPVNVVCGDPIPSKVEIFRDGTDVNIKKAPQVLSVSHSIPWGTYSLVAANKFNVVTGAGGVMMHSDGCIDINGGGRTTISSMYELNLTTSQGSLNVMGGQDVQIKGESVRVGTTDPKEQVIIDSNIGITRNATIHGSTYIDGELYVHHITAPAVLRLTSESPAIAHAPPDTVIAYTDLTIIINKINEIIGWVNAFVANYQTTCQSVQNINAANANDSMYPHGTAVATPSPGFRTPLILCTPKFGAETFYNRPGPITLALEKGLPACFPHTNDMPEKGWTVLPHQHSFYTINSDLYTSNRAVREQGSVINSGEIGVATEQINGGYGLVDGTT